MSNIKNQLTGQLGDVGKKIKRYLPIIFISSLLFLYAFLILRVSSYINMQPSEDSVNEKLQTTKRPQIDKQALEKILELQDQNIEVQSLFEEARQNPFEE
jgi:hypothetical protein